VAPTDATVLIRGESGTGKELVATVIRQHSPRANRPMVMFNCAAVQETLLESELFGHERGAFTGAVSRKEGLFDRADGGVLLGEIGDVRWDPGQDPARAPGTDVRTRRRHETVRVDVRILAATHQDLERAIVDGRFRADLYHRLNVVTLYVRRCAAPRFRRCPGVPGAIRLELGVETPTLAGRPRQLWHRGRGTCASSSTACAACSSSRGFAISATTSFAMGSPGAVDLHLAKKRRSWTRMQAVAASRGSPRPWAGTVAEAMQRAGGSQSARRCSASAYAARSSAPRVRATTVVEEGEASR
jgi:hypothetical protein